MGRSFRPEEIFTVDIAVDNEFLRQSSITYLVRSNRTKCQNISTAALTK